MSLAIIGAGISGLAAAWALRAQAADVHLFEKSRGASGRAATRGRHGCRYDHGANYFKTDSERVELIVRERLPTRDLVDIGRAVWTFDRSGRIEEGDPEADRAAKWTYREGISTLGKLLLAEAGASLHTQTRVHHLEQKPDGWTLVGTEDQRLGPFEAVLLTPPAPQTRDLLAVSRMETDLRDRLVAALEAGAYRSQLSVMLGFDRRLPRPGSFYALLNTDGGHDVAWLGFEEDKPGHVPEGQSLLVVQMAPSWSTAHYDVPLQESLPEVTERVAEVLGADPGRPAWTDLQRWRYALPDRPVDAGLLGSGAEAGLFFAGDALVGKGRVARALETGLDAARRIHTFSEAR